MQNNFLLLKNNRGVALIIVLLVTALLIALVFEFAYSTRVSLHAATNFRDSQRAYYLARSSIKAFLKYPQLRENPQGTWAVVPMISTGDTEVRIKWEDERGKLSINLIDSSPIGDRIDKLFSDQSVATDVFTKIRDRKSREGPFTLITELHVMMSDEDYRKVAQFLTTYYSDQNVNLNTASAEVLVSLGCTESSANRIVEQRSHGWFSDADVIKTYCTFALPITSINLPEKVTLYRIYSYATVGGYTKRLETVVDMSGSSALLYLYWQAL